MSALIQNTNRYEVLDPSQAASSSNDPSEPKIRYYILMGVFILTFFCGGAVYWAMSSKLDGAVVATASFEVEGNRKTVDHFDGGIVRAIHVADGDYVEAGQTLIELDSNDIDVDLNVLGSQFVDLSVRYARLTSQITGQPSFGLDDVIPTLPASVRKKDWRSSFITQQNLFQTEARARQAEVDIKEQKIKSLNTQIAGIENQRAANQRQLEITQNELSNLNALFEKGLVAVTRVNARKIEIERLIGSDLSLAADKAQAEDQIAELKLTAMSRANLRDEAFAIELAEVKTQLNAVEPQFNGATERQKRIKLVAPASGRIVDMTIFTAGGVIRPGAPILDIVPDDQALIVEARVNTTDIEKLGVGQSARVRLSAFDQGDVPEANGKIFDISADSLEDQRTGEKYYVARVRLDQKQPDEVAQLELLPGMPADLFVNTGERTALSYLAKPLSDRIARTFIE